MISHHGFGRQVSAVSSSADDPPKAARDCWARGVSPCDGGPLSRQHLFTRGLWREPFINIAGMPFLKGERRRMSIDAVDAHAVWRDGFGDLDDREVNARLQTFIVKGRARTFRVPITARVAAPDVRFLSLTEQRVQTAQFFISADELLPYDRATLPRLGRAES